MFGKFDFGGNSSFRKLELCKNSSFQKFECPPLLRTLSRVFRNSSFLRFNFPSITEARAGTGVGRRVSRSPPSRAADPAARGAQQAASAPRSHRSSSDPPAAEKFEKKRRQKRTPNPRGGKRIAEHAPQNARTCLSHALCKGCECLPQPKTHPKTPAFVSTRFVHRV